MSELKILTYPDKTLTKVSKEIKEITPAIVQLALDMLGTMYNAPGIGLAAPQVGELKRLIVMDVDYSSENMTEFMENLPKSKEDILNHPTCKVLINPEVIERSEELTECEEGCLSVPGYSEIVKRPSEITVSALLINGKKIEFKANDILAVCSQHEIDHLNGKLFIDKISSLKRNMIKKKLKNKKAPNKSPQGNL